MKFSRANIPQNVVPQNNGKKTQQVTQETPTEEEVAAYEYQQSKKMVRLKLMMALFLVVVSLVVYHWYKSKASQEGAQGEGNSFLGGEAFAKKMIRAISKDGNEVPGGRQPKDEVFRGKPPPASMQNIDLIGLVNTLKRNNVFLWGRTDCAPTAQQRALFGERGSASRQAFEEIYKECFKPNQDCPGIKGFPSFVKLDRDGVVVDKITGLVRNLEQVRRFATRDVPKSNEVNPPPVPAPSLPIIKEEENDIAERLAELEKKGRMLNSIVDELVKERVKSELEKLNITEESPKTEDVEIKIEIDDEEKEQKNIEAEAKALAKEILSGKGKEK